MMGRMLHGKDVGWEAASSPSPHPTNSGIDSHQRATYQKALGFGNLSFPPELSRGLEGESGPGSVEPGTGRFRPGNVRKAGLRVQQAQTRKRPKTRAKNARDRRRRYVDVEFAVFGSL